MSSAMLLCPSLVPAAKASATVPTFVVARARAADAIQACRLPGTPENLHTLQAAELRLGSCSGLDLGLGHNPSSKAGVRALALPRYPNHNTPYDPLEDPELDMPPEKLLKKGDPGTFQGFIKGVMPVGYWVTMPSGKEAYLPAQDIGFLGGLNRLRKIFKEGDEVTVRVVTRGSSGREVLSLKVPDPNKPDPPPKPLRKEFLPRSSLAARRRRYQQQQ